MKVREDAAGRPRRSRQEIVQANDIAVREAMLAVVGESGWDAATFTAVAKRAGLTVGAIYGRAENKSELGNLVWTAGVVDDLRAGLEQVVQAFQSGDPARLAEAFEQWESDPARSVICTEFLIAALFDEELDEVVGVDARELMAALVNWPAADGTVTPHSMAANVLVLSKVLGRMLVRRTVPDLPALEDAHIATLAAMPGQPARSQPLPRAKVTFERPALGESAETDRICAAVIDVVSRVGYRRATIARMGRAAGMSGGALFARFQDKAQLVAEAARARLVSPYDLWIEFGEVQSAHGPTLSRAMWVADVVRRQNRQFWSANLELARVSHFVPELTDFRASAVPHYYTNLGVMFVASFAPDLHELPYAGPFQAGFTT